MDYYSFDSEVIESLNFLRPPVKRSSANRNRDCSVYTTRTNNNIKVLREGGHKLRNKRLSSCKQASHEHEGSSTSLILKKTTDSQIFKQYPVANYTSSHYPEQSTLNIKQHAETDTVQSQNRYKPLIQVTVIPKTNQNPGSKLFRNQRIITNTVQTTSSYHENSIQTRNVYLVVAGRKKDKIYEIKATGSEKFEKKFVGDEAVENLSNFKQFIKTLNMERKRRKDKAKHSKIDTRNESNDCETKQPNEGHDCKCLPQDRHEVRPGRSRVRVFGRIGLTEDDQYILKCQATVDDQPVATSQLSTAEKQLSSSSLATFSRNNQTMTCQRIDGMACVREIPREDIKSVRDSIMQTEFRNNAAYELLINTDNNNRISKDSQSTQVNFYKPTGNSMNKTSPFRTSEQVTRCNCSNDYPVIKPKNNGHDGKNLKPCQSPLVIISVFPKQDNNLADIVQTLQCTQIDNKYPMLPENIITKSTDSKTVNKTTVNRNTKKSVRSRSPSAKGQKMKSKPIKTSVRNESPPHSKGNKKDTKKGTNSLKQKLEFFNSNAKKENTDRKRKPSPPRSLSPRTKTPPASPNKKEPQKRNASRQSLKPKTKSKGKVDKGINTEHLKTKKALVDSYTNKITEQMKSRKERENPVQTVSAVSVNIDNENEYYDLSFCQHNLTTDIKVRKTMKEASAQKYFDENQPYGSLENFFPSMSRKHQRGSVCHRSICENLSDDFKNNVPRLTLRDSLEIGHRREDKAYKITQTRRPDSEDITVNNADMDFLAPIKHYTGDDCTICDPIERDKEIRELLGVEGRRNKSQFPQGQNFEMGDQISRHCFYSNQCKKTFITAFGLHQPNSCECIEETESFNIMNKLEPLADQNEEKRTTDASQKPQQSTVDEECACICSTRKHKTVYNEQNRQSGKCPCSDKSANICNLPTCENYNQTQRDTDKTGKVSSGRKTQPQTDEPTGQQSHHQYNKTELSGQKSNKTKLSRQQTQVEDERKKPDQKNNDDILNEHVEQDQNGVISGKNNANTSQEYEVPNLDRTSLYQQLTLNRNIQIFLQVEQFAKQKPIVLSRKQYDKIKKTIQNTVGRDKRCICNRSSVSVGPTFGKTHNVLVCTNREVQTDTTRKQLSIKEGKRYFKSKTHSKKEHLDTVVLFSNEFRESFKDNKPPKVVLRQAASSLEIRNASIEYWKHVALSSTNVGSIGSSSFALRNKKSVETIFRGHKKSLTPNLGTSAFSLLSEAHLSESQSMKICSPNAKAKKPFLKRLMSCLVLRSKTSEKPGPDSFPPSVNSSVDSYHISTSLGAIEMSSSIYDTSASFYSNHSIHPLSNKFKRSFFNSVRGFLTSRKS